MQSKIVWLIVGLVLAMVTVGPGISHGSDTDPEFPELPESCPALYAARSAIGELPLVDCGEANEVVQSQELCAATNSQIDLLKFRELRDRLLEQSLGAPTLCSIDVALTRALEQCVCNDLVEVETFAELAMRVADNWLRLESPSNARRMYLLAQHKLPAPDQPSLSRIRVIRGLVAVEVSVGQTACAIGLASLQTKLSRDWYQDEHVPVGLLIDSLEFEGGTLVELGKHAEASAIYEEAEALKNSSKECDGVCRESLRKVER